MVTQRDDWYYKHRNRNRYDLGWKSTKRGAEKQQKMWKKKGYKNVRIRKAYTPSMKGKPHGYFLSGIPKNRWRK